MSPILQYALGVGFITQDLADIKSWEGGVRLQLIN